MSQIVGAIYFNQKPMQHLAAMVDAVAYWQPDKITKAQTLNAGFAQLILYTTQESLTEILPLETKRYILVADARIDNREDLNAQLQFSSNRADSLYILAAYEKWGEACCRYLLGDYAFVIYDKQAQTAFCGRDIFGIRPLYYYYDHHLFAFSSEVKALFQLPEIKKQLNKPWLAELMTRGVLMTTEYTDETYHQHILQLTPAHSMTITNKQLQKHRYWQLDIDSPLQFETEHDCIERLTHHIDQAVKTRTRCYQNIGCELSGGLDSSTVTTFAHQYRPDCHTFTNAPHPNSDYLNEWPYAQMVCQHLGVTNAHAIQSDEFDIEQAIKDYVLACDGPTAVLFPLLCVPVQRAAMKHNCRVMLSGFGGDECVSQSGKLYLAELVQNRDYKTLRHELRANNKLNQRRRLKQLLSLYCEYRTPALYKRIQQLRHGKQPVPLSFFQLPEALQKDSALAPRFSQFKDIHLGDTVAMLSKNLLTDRLGWHIPERARCTYLMSKKCIYTYPLLDRRLIEFAIHIPANLKYKNSISRYALRKVLEPKLPQEIVYRFNKSGTPAPSALHVLQQYLKKQNKQPTQTTLFKTILIDKEHINLLIDSYCKMMRKLS